MSMFSFPTDLNMSEMMKPASAMTDWTKAADFPVSPLMVHPLGAAAAATAIGFGIAGQMSGMMMGAMQAAMQSQGAVWGAKPDLSWIVPTLAEDLAPEEEEAEVAEVAEAAKPAARAASADVVTLKPSAKPKAASTKAAKPKTPTAKTEKSPAPVKAKTEAAVERLKSDAEVAAAVAGETATVAKAEPKPEATPALEPEDFRRPAEIEKPETPDDLKLISGIGPKLEQVLNGLGVWTFAQIADWKPEEAAWVDDYLQFSGRIGRDNWISQAGALAKGGSSAE